MTNYENRETGDALRAHLMCANALLLRFCTNYAYSVSILDETGFYAPSMAHNTLPSHPWLGISVFMCIILQYLNSFASRLHEGVPSPGCVPGLPVFLRCDWIFICVGSYSAAEQDNHPFYLSTSSLQFFL